MELAVVLMLLLVSGSIGGTPEASKTVERAFSAVANASEVAWYSFCHGDDFNIRTQFSLYFQADKNATRRNHFIGNDSQLQCMDPDSCASSGYLKSADCYNRCYEETCDSEPTWDCYVSFPESAYSLDKAKVNCEQSPTDSNCVLKGSCILLYSSHKVFPFYFWLLLSLGILGILYFVIQEGSSVKDWCSRNRTQTAEEAAPDQGPATQTNYNAATDAPPSYNTVERNPQRFEKPCLEKFPSHWTDERQAAEAPPPSYDSVSGSC